MNVHQVKGGDWGGLHDERDVCGNEVGGANLIDEDGSLKVVSFGKELVKGVGELRGEDYCFPFGMVGSDIELSHRVMKTFTKVGMR